VKSGRGVGGSGRIILEEGLEKGWWDNWGGGGGREDLGLKDILNIFPITYDGHASAEEEE
jgi:hypothetical protein